jgi:hypothetical protein
MEQGAGVERCRAASSRTWYCPGSNALPRSLRGVRSNSICGKAPVTARSYVEAEAVGGSSEARSSSRGQRAASRAGLIKEGKQQGPRASK